MKYKIVVRKQGQPDETRLVDAESRFQVYEDIHKEGGYVASLAEKSAGFDLNKLMQINFGTGVKTEERIAFRAIQGTNLLVRRLEAQRPDLANRRG